MYCNIAEIQALQIASHSDIDSARTTRINESIWIGTRLALFQRGPLNAAMHRHALRSDYLRLHGY